MASQRSAISDAKAAMYDMFEQVIERVHMQPCVCACAPARHGTGRRVRLPRARRCTQARAAARRKGSNGRGSGGGGVAASVTRVLSIIDLHAI